jgi:processive 1,2-diacylglycerol beta-glucosyltransferase
MSKRILIVTEEWAGSGHRMAAVALREAVETRSADSVVRIVGGLEQTSPSLRELSRLFYLNSLHYCPGLWQRVYDRERLFGDMLKKPLGKWLSRRLIERVLEKDEPDVVVATHAYCLSALAEAKRLVRKPFRLVSIPTDYYVNRFWVHPQIDGYVVAHERVAEQLEQQHSVQRGKVAVFGIPVRRTFDEAVRTNKEEWKRRLGLRPELFTILLCGGEGGYGRMDWVLQSLMAAADPLQIVVITGRNQQLKAQLDTMSSCSIHRHHILVKGYESAMWEWIGAADAYVTKPGGISCAEALAMKTPLILYQPLPGQEHWNTRFLQDHQVATLANDPQEITEIVREWKKRSSTWREIISRMEEVRRPDSAERAAEYLLQL